LEFSKLVVIEQMFWGWSRDSRLRPAQVWMRCALSPPQRQSTQ